jgi:hypothetical protein
MRLTIVNITNSIKSPHFQEVVRALRRQVNEDFTPIWNAAAILRGVTHKLGKAKIEGVHDAFIYLGDSSQDPDGGVANAYGYHSANYDDIPFGFVYLDVCEKYGEEWSSTLSHEVLELLADPAATLTVAGPNPKHQAPHTVQYDVEVCDPTQGDGYSIDDVRVSNFVTPAYFGKSGGVPETNFLRLPLKPFGVRPGGYFQYEAGSSVHQIDGETVSPARVEARKSLALYRRNARRKERLEKGQAALSGALRAKL